MLDTVLYARDKYLVKGGLILPDKCQMYIAGIEDGQYKEEKIHYWEDVYGFDYSPFIKTAMEEPLVDTVNKQALVTNSFKFLSLILTQSRRKNFLSKESLNCLPLRTICVMRTLFIGMPYSRKRKGHVTNRTNEPVYSLETNSILHGPGIGFEER